MKNTIHILILLIIMSTFSFSSNYSFKNNNKSKFNYLQKKDEWMSFDKLQHFSFSFLLCLSSQYILENKINFSHKKSLQISISQTFAIGLGKEIYDSKKKDNFFSKKDFAANTLGIILASLLIIYK